MKMKLAVGFLQLWCSALLLSFRKEEGIALVLSGVFVVLGAVCIGQAFESWWGIPKERRSESEEKRVL